MLTPSSSPPTPRPVPALLCSLCPSISPCGTWPSRQWQPSVGRAREVIGRCWGGRDVLAVFPRPSVRQSVSPSVSNSTDILCPRCGTRYLRYCTYYTVRLIASRAASLLADRPATGSSLLHPPTKRSSTTFPSSPFPLRPSPFALRPSPLTTPHASRYTGPLSVLVPPIPGDHSEGRAGQGDTARNEGPVQTAMCRHDRTTAHNPRLIAGEVPSTWASPFFSIVSSVIMSISSLYSVSPKYWVPTLSPPPSIDLTSPVPPRELRGAEDKFLQAHGGVDKVPGPPILPGEVQQLCIRRTVQYNAYYSTLSLALSAAWTSHHWSCAGLSVWTLDTGHAGPGWKLWPLGKTTCCIGPRGPCAVCDGRG